ncbi:MAG: dephospho-CoA kinase [Crocinitomicaceae bacterium]|nr:dephospho-CoA kinase [Crocinitomicaceae bacterium]
MDSTITVGITGGIGTGKSIICRALSIMGYPVFYSDDQAKLILENDPLTIEKVKEFFGESAYRDSKPDRGYIASKIFNQPELRSALNSIIHPKVRQKFVEWSENQNSSVVFNEAAILFETGAYKNFSYTILITAPEEIRINRIKKRDQAAAEEIRKRMASQWPDEQKIPMADFVIENDDQKAVLPQLSGILKKIKP